ncbi:N-acetylglucosamine-6-phosphate deacetylase [Rufibacter glacialis]|uniref:N-acetylglucosamine-6-phosphate deacetylase n=1 Tax=Rufibacter glacialis TaxID=1259555 RepID=A0A5M8Q563_9BACT|nr:N-acetylglucosamine-6-phosphate deacetylase [Rufibacter glacialis]KAA6430979.1 N-acetylglucosamine-6-phosphate deacetylase [Rufibacter glacialis]GGK83025.1 N-acetylglucosamine-6-phosphate deacetylase [Rufibacter glacialis]
MRFAFTNGTIYSGYTTAQGYAVLVEDGKIKDLVQADEIPADTTIIDVNGGVICPGFVDLQVNGGGGVYFTQYPTLESLNTIRDAHLQFGTTSFLPTVISAFQEKILETISAVREGMQQYPSTFLGMHLEGPYFNPGKAGAHDTACIRVATHEELDVLLEAGKDVITYLTLAPECVEESVLQRLVESGIVLSAGHSLATYDQAMHFFRNGVTAITHLYNAMSGLDTKQPGLAAAALDYGQAWTGIIVDGEHCHPYAVRLAKKMLGEKLLLISDCAACVGSDIPFTDFGNFKAYYRNGRCETEDGRLAGSALTMLEAVQNTVKMVGLPLDEALRMATLYPAQVLKLEDKVGQLVPGSAANLVVLTPDLQLQQVWVDGEAVALHKK